MEQIWFNQVVSMKWCPRTNLAEQDHQAVLQAYKKASQKLLEPQERFPVSSLICGWVCKREYFDGHQYHLGTEVLETPEQVRGVAPELAESLNTGGIRYDCGSRFLIPMGMVSTKKCFPNWYPTL